jgi:hypothetical protein
MLRNESSLDPEPDPDGLRTLFPRASESLQGSRNHIYLLYGKCTRMSCSLLVQCVSNMEKISRDLDLGDSVPSI